MHNDIYSNARHDMCRRRLCTNASSLVLMEALSLLPVHLKLEISFVVAALTNIYISFDCLYVK